MLVIVAACIMKGEKRERERETDHSNFEGERERKSGHNWRKKRSLRWILRCLHALPFSSLSCGPPSHYYFVIDLA